MPWIDNVHLPVNPRTNLLCGEPGMQNFRVHRSVDELKSTESLLDQSPGVKCSHQVAEIEACINELCDVERT